MIPDKNEKPKKFLHVEFVGAAGAGKTETAKALGSRLSQKGFRVALDSDFSKFGWWQRHFLPVAYALRRGRSRKALVEFGALSGRLFSARPLESLKRCLVREFLFQRINATAYIFDDGTINKLSVIPENKLHAADIGRLLAELLIPEGSVPVIIVVETPVDKAIGRVLGDPPRGREFLLAMSEKDRRAFYHSQLASQEKIIRVLRDGQAGGGWIVLAVDGTASLEENVKYIISEIEKRFHAH